MNSNRRGIFLTLFALMVMCAVCSGLVFLLMGDQLIDIGRLVAANVALLPRQDDLERSVSDNTNPVRFVVNSGDTPAIIGQNLVNEDLIIDANLFVTYVRAYSLDTELEAGIFFLDPSQTIPEIAAALTDSRFSQIELQIPEGWRIEQIAERVDANPLFGFSGEDFLGAVGAGAEVDAVFAERVGLPAGASLEGFLFPATYQFPATATPELLRDEFLETFFLNVDDALIADAEAQGLSIFEVVTLASIVEREAIHHDEKPRIASVYRNRMDINMRLEADPTVQYPLDDSRNGWWPRITVADYTGVESEYNTYLNNGLPPGPIANPGIVAIQAVIYPEETDFFYFRADCRSDGYHEFARTYEEHVNNGC